MKMDASKCVQESEGGVILFLSVTPNADKSKFPAGVDEWRKSIKISVAAPPEENRANKEVIQVVAAFFEIQASQVSIISGSTSRRKKAHIEGVAIERITDRLASWSAGHEAA